MKKNTISTIYVLEKVNIPGKIFFKAECKTCKKEKAGLVARVKAHFNSCILATGSYIHEDSSKLERIVEGTAESRKRQAIDRYMYVNKRLY